MQTIVATLDDVPLVSRYLHDSNLDLREVTLSEGSLSIPLERVGYESGKKGRFLWVVPSMRYPVVPSVLQLENVRELTWTWRRPRDEVEGTPNNLLAIEASPNRVDFETDYFTMTASLNSFNVLRVIDIGQPSGRLRITDVGKRKPSHLSNGVAHLRQDA